MTAPRNSDDLVRAFLAEGPTDLPDQAFDAVRGEIHRTRQRAVIGPWRTPNMSNLVRIAFAAAVVGAIALAWVNFGPRQGGVGTAPTPIPTQSPSPSPTTAGLPATSLVNLTGSLAPGTYSYPAGSWTPVRITFAVPAGWSADDSGFVTKHAGAADEVVFAGWQVTHVFTDACHHEDNTLVSAGTTITELASALTAQKGRVASATTDVTVGGFPAKRLELTVPADVDISTCVNGVVRPWPDPGPDLSGGYSFVPVGSIDQESIVDASGNRLVFIARHMPGSSAADQAELQSIVDSIAIEAPSASASPSGASAAP
jgi:hypothetical protein